MTASAFLWGKLPAHGDFVGRGLGADERDALDLWLAASLAEARTLLGEAFEASYDEAPPWRFRWREGEAWVAGAMVPSMDGVGRRYPLLVGRRGVVSHDTPGIAAAAEDALYAAFEHAMTADTLHEAVATFDGRAPREDEDGEDPMRDGEGWWTLGGESYPPSWQGSARPDGLWRNILERRQGAEA